MNRNIKLLKIASVLMGMGFFTPVVSLYFLSKGVGISQVVLAQTLYSLMIVVMEVPTGAVADRYGHKTSVILGLLLQVPAYITYLLLPQFLFFGYALSGIGDSLISGSLEALTHKSSVEGTYRRNWAAISANSVYAMAIGSVVAGLIYWRFETGGFVPIIVCALLVKLFAAFIIGASRDGGGSGDVVVSDSKLFVIVRSAMSQIRHNSTLRNLAYIQMLTLSAQYVLYAAYQPYFIDNRVPAIFIGLVLSVGAIMNGKSIKLVAQFEKFISLDKAVLIFPLLMSATYLTFSLIRSPWLLVVVFVFLQAQFNLLDPMISDYVNYETKPETRATVISGISFIRSIANVASKFLLGLSIAGFGVVGMFRLQAIYLLAGGVISYWLLKRCGCTYALRDRDERI